MQFIFSILLAVCVSSCLYLMLDFMKGGGAQENRQIKQRLESLFTRRTKIERSSSFSNIFRLNQVLKRQPLSKKLFTLLSLTGWNIPISIFILADLVWGALAYMIMGLLGVELLASIMITATLITLPYWVLVINKKRYVAKFTLVLPDALMLIKSAIRAGQGVQAAFKMVSQEGPYPVSREFAQVVREIELGSQLTEALGELYRRIETTDLRIFVLGIFIQHEVGGNLYELLDHVEKTIRERISMSREIKVLSAQGKMTGLVLMLLPFFLAFALWVLNPGYFDPMIHEDGGRKMMGAAVLMQMCGAFFVRRITHFNVI